MHISILFNIKTNIRMWIKHFFKRRLFFTIFVEKKPKKPKKHWICSNFSLPVFYVVTYFQNVSKTISLDFGQMSVNLPACCIFFWGGGRHCRSRTKPQNIIKVHIYLPWHKLWPIKFFCISSKRWLKTRYFPDMCDSFKISQYPCFGILLICKIFIMKYLDSIFDFITLHSENCFTTSFSFTCE